MQESSQDFQQTGLIAQTFNSATDKTKNTT